VLLASLLPVAAEAQRTAPPRDPIATYDALRRLDAALGDAGAELARVDARVSAVRDGGRTELATPVVVLLRAQSGAAATVQSATVEMDGAPLPMRRYGAADREALRAGAADELFHGALPPGAHVVRAIVTVAGAATRAATVAVPSSARPTWIELTLRDGGLDGAAWASAPAATRR